MEAEHYAGWESKKATFGWFDTVIRDEDEMVVEEGISSEELYRRLQTSYETFGFHDNPLNIQKQLQLIAKKADQWIYAMPDASEEILDIVYYTVTDLDENGRLEVITSLVNTTHENSASWYYEVNESYSNYSDWKLIWFDFSDMVSATTKVNITQEPVYEKLLDVYYENEFVAKD